MVLTSSPSRMSSLVCGDIDRLGTTPRKENRKLELPLPVILESAEEATPQSSPTHTPRNNNTQIPTTATTTTTTTTTTTPSTHDITTMSNLLRDFMISLVTNPSAASNMSSALPTSPRHARLNACVCSDIDNICSVAPSLATSPMRTRSPSRHITHTPTLPRINEQNEDMTKAMMLSRLSLELGNVIQQQNTTTPRSQTLTSPSSCRYVPMGSPHKLRAPPSASSSVTPSESPDSSPLMSHRSLMIM